MSAKPWSVWTADSMMQRREEYTNKWAYDYGVLFKGIEEVYYKTGDEQYFKYIERTMDGFIDENGDIALYKNVNNIDHINLGKVVLFMYNNAIEEKKARYKKAADLLRDQLHNHPRTSDGVFWHKQIYPSQIWLDGIYMGSPFYAQYIREIEGGTDFSDVTKQVINSFKHLYDEKTGLMHHAIDESREGFWCDKQTGLSENYWERSIGWFAMACADLLDYLPENDKDKVAIISIYEKVVDGMLKHRDAESGVWYQVVNMHDRKGNYKEATASNMMVYSIAKGIVRGHLSRDKYLNEVKRSYQGILDEFITTTNNGRVNVNKNCQGAGLGPQTNTNRDGSFAYYISEPIVSNNPFGSGSFILASIFMEELLK